MPNFFNKYPYTDFHELNLDWLLHKMRELEIEFDEFKVVNNITFSGQWDITKQYPAWTIVSDNNIGYVSQKPVPVGVPLTNGSYWVEVIDYTAQIAGLENRVIAIEDDLRDNVHPDILQNAADIADINHRINIDKRSFLFVGDSYGTVTNSWVDVCVNDCGIVDYANLSAAGAAFFDGKFLNQITGYTGDKNNITDIVVGGGLNDARFNSGNADYNTCKQAILDFASYAKTNYPNAKLWLAFMGNALDNAPLLSGRTYDKRAWAKWCYEDIGRSAGFTLINGSDAALGTNALNFLSDGLHPNTAGSNVIGHNVANVLLNGTEIKSYPLFLVGVHAVTGVVLSANNMEYICSDGEITITLPTSLIATIGSVYNTFSGSAKLDIMTMDSLHFNKTVVKDVDVRLDNFNSRGYTHLQAKLIFEDDTISIKFNEINAAGTGYDSFTANNANSSLVINEGFTFSIPYQYIN